MRNIVKVMIGSLLLLTAETLATSASAALAPAAQAFEQACIRARESCEYAHIRYESAHEIYIETHIYPLLRDRHDVGIYNALVNAVLKAKGVRSLNVLSYDYNKKTWNAFDGIEQCKYCVNAHMLKSGHDMLLRIDAVRSSTAKPDYFLGTSFTVYRDQNLKKQIIVSAPSVFNGEDHTSIYIDSRVKSKHATTSFNTGGITIDLDGHDVNSFLPDYVITSPVKSWRDVALEYRQHQVGLLKATGRLPEYTDPELGQRLDHIAQQLHAYGIRYLAINGFYPSVTPEQLIADREGDCNALATLAKALLGRSGIDAQVIAVGGDGQPPLSFNVPDASWGPLHALLYIPGLDVYINPTDIAITGSAWKTSADAFRGAIGLNMATGQFVVVH